MIDRKTWDINKEVAAIRNDVGDIKSAQDSGSDNYVIYKTESQTYTYSATGGLIEPTVTFTADSLLNAFAELNARVYASGSEIFNWSFEAQKTVSASDSLVTHWFVQIQHVTGSPASSLQVVWYVLSFDRGVISG